MLKLFIFSLGILLATFLSSCGGGTAGTGGFQEYRGTITDSSGRRLQNISVTITETGSSGITDSQGQFIIQSDSGLSEITLLIEGEDVSQTVPVRLDDASDSISISVSVDTKDLSSNSFSADIRVKIVGECDLYFENTRPIRQANLVPRGKDCSLRVSMRNQTGGIPFRDFALQVSGCRSQNLDWTTYLTGVTNDIGTGFLKFAFEDSLESCIYRVLVPLNDNKIPPLEFPIHTFTYQSKIQNKK